MALTLDATPGSAAATSYLTLAAFDARLEVAGVTAGTYSDDARARALIQATARLDYERYVGLPTTATQALQWPRTGALWPERPGSVYPDSVIPRRIADATAELALAICAGADLRAVDEYANYSKARVDVIDVTFRDTVAAPDALTRWPAVWRAIAPLLLLDVDGDGVPDVPRPTAASYRVLRSLR